MLGYGTLMHTYRLWDIENNKLVIGRNVTFNERSVLEQAKEIKITNSEAAQEDIKEEDDDTLVDDLETTNEDFTDVVDTSLDYSVDRNNTHGIEENNTELRRSRRKV